MLVATITAGNAQFFVEGSVGVDCSENGIDNSNLYETSSFSISISPQVGYWLNDKVAIGTRVTLSKYDSKYKLTNPSNPEYNRNSDTKTSRWQFSAFSRYKLWGTGKISLLLDGSIYYEGSREITNYEGETSVTKNSTSGSRFGCYVFPAVSYDLNKKFSIIAKCNFFSLNFYSENKKLKNTSDGYTTNNKSRDYHFNSGTSSNILSLGNINIGFIYNF